MSRISEALVAQPDVDALIDLAGGLLEDTFASDFTYVALFDSEAELDLVSLLQRRRVTAVAAGAAARRRAYVGGAASAGARAAPRRGRFRLARRASRRRGVPGRISACRSSRATTRSACSACSRWEASTASTTPMFACSPRSRRMSDRRSGTPTSSVSNASRNGGTASWSRRSPIAMYRSPEGEQNSSEYMSPRAVAMFGYPLESWSDPDFYAHRSPPRRPRLDPRGERSASDRGRERLGERVPHDHRRRPDDLDSRRVVDGARRGREGAVRPGLHDRRHRAEAGAGRARRRRCEALGVARSSTSRLSSSSARSPSSSPTGTSGSRAGIRPQTRALRLPARRGAGPDDRRAAARRRRTGRRGRRREPRGPVDDGRAQRITAAVAQGRIARERRDADGGAHDRRRAHGLLRRSTTTSPSCSAHGRRPRRRLRPRAPSSRP